MAQHEVYRTNVVGHVYTLERAEANKVAFLALKSYRRPMDPSLDTPVPSQAVSAASAATSDEKYPDSGLWGSSALERSKSEQAIGRNTPPKLKDLDRAPTTPLDVDLGLSNRNKRKREGDAPEKRVLLNPVAVKLTGVRFVDLSFC